MSHPIVLIELNEVPNKVLDYYRKHSTFMDQFLSKSHRYETITPDQIQLDPWIAWPTLHRGVNDEEHRLLRLGQETTVADDRFPPVWRILRDQGVPVGVYGSLFSSCEQDYTDYKFFVPDVFSPHSKVFPEGLEKFQAFNLAMTRASARNADSKVSSGGSKVILDLMTSGRLQMSTVSRMAKQILSEKKDPKKVSRRRNIQTDLHADVYCHLLKASKPQFSTFYTNNVAAAMHRFWSAAFSDPSLNAGRLNDQWVQTYSTEIAAALDSVERLLRRLCSGQFGPVTIVVASALGQEEIPAENHANFLTIGNIGRFIDRLLSDSERSGRYSIRPAMVPDFTIKFDSPDDTQQLVKRLQLLEIDGMRPVETLQRMLSRELVEAGNRMKHIRHDYASDGHFKHPITFSKSDESTVHISFQVDDYAGNRSAKLGNETLSFEELGVATVSHDEGVNCTAQHCAAGSLTVWSPEMTPRSGVSTVSSLDFLPSVLAHYGKTVPNYLKGENTIQLSRV